MWHVDLELHLTITIINEEESAKGTQDRIRVTACLITSYEHLDSAMSESVPFLVTFKSQ